MSDDVGDERRADTAAEDVEKLKARLKQLEGSAKCSKCVVSFLIQSKNIFKYYEI